MATKPQTPIIVANWKMAVDPMLSEELAGHINAWAENYRVRPKIVLCPSFLAMRSILAVATRIEVGAQDCFWENHGAYTGEVSPQELMKLGVRYVLVGHSERRIYCHETEAIVRQKTLAALQAGLTPIVCVGESKEDRLHGRAEAIVLRQVTHVLKDIRLVAHQQLWIAYEPLWAIGAAHPATPVDAQKMHEVINRVLRDTIPSDELHRTAVLYGGSVDHASIAEFLSQPSIDGVLMGRASWKAQDFIACLTSAHGTIKR